MIHLKKIIFFFTFLILTACSSIPKNTQNSCAIFEERYYRIENKKELEQLGIFKEDIDSIKIIEWPELVKTNLSDKLELHFNYSQKENERDLRFVGHGKWKDINKDEL